MKREKVKKIFENVHPGPTIPRRHTIRRPVLDQQNSLGTQMTDLLSLVCGKVFLTADSWYSTIYKGYIVIAGHWIASKWGLYSAKLKFIRFLSPHMVEATFSRKSSRAGI